MCKSDFKGYFGSVSYRKTICILLRITALLIRHIECFERSINDGIPSCWSRIIWPRLSRILFERDFAGNQLPLEGHLIRKWLNHLDVGCGRIMLEDLEYTATREYCLRASKKPKGKLETRTSYCVFKADKWKKKISEPKSSRWIALWVSVHVAKTLTCSKTEEQNASTATWSGRRGSEHSQCFKISRQHFPNF